MKAPRSFEFIAGALALDFVDTVALRKTAPFDLLRSPDDLDTWFEMARVGVASTRQATHVELEQARELREAIFRASRSAARGNPLDAEDVAIINAMARLAASYPQIGDEGIQQISDGGVDAALSLIAIDAVNLLGSELKSRIRSCSGCGMYFVDRSRPGKRQWCSSGRRCGNLNKVRRHRERKSRAQDKK